MSQQNMLRVGIIGSIITAICCFTPVLVIVMGLVGLSALASWLDIVLLPALALFLAMTGYGFWKRQTSRSS